MTEPSPPAAPKRRGAGNGPRRRVLVCEPYCTGSHRAWAEGLERHSRHDVRLVAHEGRFWRWRMQGSALTLAAHIDAVVAAWGRPDVALVSDMVLLPALLGFARRALGGVPVVLYMHENQLTYPLPEGVPRDPTHALANWLSLAAADRVVFNSEHHRRAVLDALPRFLRRYPDHRHTGEVARVAEAAAVLPVGVDAARFARPRAEHDPPVVLWNHRWEYDKHPDAFFAALAALADAGVAFSVILAGASPPRAPQAFERARTRLGPRVIHFGTASDEEYPALLAAADVVVSTARHEFFGLAVVEAVTAGALPVLPARLSYPELVPRRDPFLYEDHEDLVRRLRWALTHPAARRTAAREAQAYARRFAWPAVAARYDDLLAGM
jgi:glycosyltransferase involved in cell wall biosynthesis